jgi:16S rRNA (guanine1207-N2)-methyltransferase
MRGASPQYYDLPMIERHVAAPARARALELGYYDPSAALWLARRVRQVLALRPAVDLAAELDRQARAAGLANLEVRVTTQPQPSERGTFDLALLLAPFFLGNAPVRHAICTAAQALKSDGVLYFQVHRRRGGDTFVGYACELFASVEPVARGAGQRRLFAATGPRAPAAEPVIPQADRLYDLTLRGVTVRFRLAAGVFSARGIDPGSRLLLDTAQVPPGAKVLDLGCGAGVIGLAIAALDPRARVVLVDSSAPAVELARENAARNRLVNVDVRLGDAYQPVAGERFDAILSNLPAHRGYQEQLATAERFISGAPDHLRAGGGAWFVANRALPYERPAARVFGQVRLAASDRRYKVLHCTEPRSGPARGRT